MAISPNIRKSPYFGRPAGSADFGDFGSQDAEGVDIFRDSEEGAFDIILMDVMMPVMDGLSAARAIRSMERKDATVIPIIAMTANAFDEDRRRSREAGMDRHLAKPLDPQEIIRTINECVKSR